MSVLDRVDSQAPAAVLEARSLARALEDRYWLPMRYHQARRLVGHQHIADAIVDPDGPPSGIYGTGVVAYESGEIAPAVFCIPELVSASAKRGSVVDSNVAPGVPIYDLLTDNDNTRFEKLSGHLRAIGYPKPTEQSAIELPARIRASVQAERRAGTAGVPVWSANGRPAFMTAGHVVKNLDALVYYGSQRIGRVQSVSHVRAPGPAGEPVADVGIVEMHESAAYRAGRGRIQATQAKVLSSVVVDTPDGGRPAWVRAMIESFAFKQGTKCWKDVLLTDRAASAEGDSGSPVFLDSSEGALVGHIVAGVAQAYSLIQDIDVLLGSSGATIA